MYEVDSLDKVIQLHDAPKSQAGAPLPLVVCDENRLLLAYLVSEPSPDCGGVHPTSVSPESRGMAVAIVCFQRPSAHVFGPPNDEAFSGHPLASRGLTPYGVFEIQQSSWIRRLERMNSVHPRHDRTRFMAGRRHFIFAFHDSVFECIAETFESQVRQGTMHAALDRMTSLLVESWR